jgi:hypothetical protein
VKSQMYLAGVAISNINPVLRFKIIFFKLAVGLSISHTTIMI